MRYFYLSNVHSSRRFKTIITNRLRLFSQEVEKFIFLNALFSDASHDLKSLLRTQQPMIDYSSIMKIENRIQNLDQNERTENYCGVGFGFGLVDDDSATDNDSSPTAAATASSAIQGFDFQHYRFGQNFNLTKASQFYGQQHP